MRAKIIIAIALNVALYPQLGLADCPVVETNSDVVTVTTSTDSLKLIVAIKTSENDRDTTITAVMPNELFSSSTFSLSLGSYFEAAVDPAISTNSSCSSEDGACNGSNALAHEAEVRRIRSSDGLDVTAIRVFSKNPSTAFLMTLERDGSGGVTSKCSPVNQDFNDSAWVQSFIQQAGQYALSQMVSSNSQSICEVMPSPIPEGGKEGSADLCAIPYIYSLDLIYTFDSGGLPSAEEVSAYKKDLTKVRKEIKKILRTEGARRRKQMTKKIVPLLRKLSSSPVVTAMSNDRTRRLLKTAQLSGSLAANEKYGSRATKQLLNQSLQSLSSVANGK